MAKLSTFEIILLIVGVAAAILGFMLINQVFLEEGKLSWLMVIAIFSWLILLVLFISLSITVDVSKKQLEELKNLTYLLHSKKRK